MKIIYRCMLVIVMSLVAYANTVAQTTQPSPSTNTKMLQEAYSKADLKDGVNQAEARELASAYAATYILGGGGILKVHDKGEYWLAETLVGFAAESGPPISIHKKTAAMTCMDHPIVTFLPDRQVTVKELGTQAKAVSTTQPADKAKEPKVSTAMLTQAYAKVELDDGVNESEARELASAYAATFILGGGAITKANDKGTHWLLQTRLGRGAKMGPLVRVEKKNGMLSCDDYPKVHLNKSNSVIITPSKVKKAEHAQSITGKAYIISGNQMPGPGLPAQAKGGLPLINTPIHIFTGKLEPLRADGKAEKHPQFKMTIKTDETGQFSIALPAGTYTLVLEIDGKLYRQGNIYDAKEQKRYWPPTVLKSGENSNLNLTDNRNATY